MKRVSHTKVHQGIHAQYTHESSTLSCSMQFAIYLPPSATSAHPVPVLYWLSGLTCTDENFMQKAGAFRKASALGIAIVAPDTSPRGEGVPDAPDQAYDLGHGAGFYLNATQPLWSPHYQMYDYIVHELPPLIEAHFPVTSDRAISGHSMGGHGALTIGIKHQEMYRSISAFAPICHPIDCPWGKKAFQHYLGDNQENWKDYDATELLKRYSCALPILIDQGSSDPFLTEQLKPEALIQLAKNQPTCEFNYHLREGYDHSYYFIQSFIEDHLEFHAQYLKQTPA